MVKNIMSYILIIWCLLNSLGFYLVYKALKRRPQELKGSKGKIIAHTFVTKKLK